MTELLIRWPIYSLLLMIGYLPLRRQTHFLLNRIYLLCLLPVSLLLSFVSVPGTDIPLANENIVLPAITVHQRVSALPGPAASFLSPLLVVYLTGALVMLLISLWQFRGLMRRLKRGSWENGKIYRICWMEETVAPSSFFRLLILPRHLPSSQLKMVMAHELVHIRRYHSIDRVCMELLTILFYFHPLTWLIRRELRLLHEYEADAEVVHTHRPSRYKQLLLEAAIYGQYWPMVNTFGRSHLKSRFLMMNRKRSGRWAPIRAALVLPMVVAATLFFSLPGTGVPVLTTEFRYPDFMVEDKAPEFPGGQTAFFDYMSRNLVYPQSAKDAKLEGKVFVSFTVEADGKITDAKVVKGISTDLDNEALRVVKNMPNWVPGTKNGKPATYTLTLPIMFALGPVENPGPKTGTKSQNK